MKYFFYVFAALLLSSCNSQFSRGVKSYATSTFFNKNVYKTKSNLTVRKMFRETTGPTEDQRDFTIQPTALTSTVTKTTISSTTTPAGAGGIPASETKTTTTITTIPPTRSTSTTVVISPVVPAPTATTISSTTTFSVPAIITLNDFIRYKVVADEGDFKYIKVLPGCYFVGIPPQDTNIQVIPPGAPPGTIDQVKEYIFQVPKKSLNPNTHYLSSSALIGKVVTMPVRIRREYWDDDNRVLSGALALGLSFGWKFKLGNHPYRPHYVSAILYGAGISQQKYFAIKAGQPTAKTDEMALTYFSFGAAYEYDKFNIGIFWGKDRMIGNLKDWAYQDKWWWGFGIGYDVFK